MVVLSLSAGKADKAVPATAGGLLLVILTLLMIARVDLCVVVGSGLGRLIGVTTVEAFKGLLSEAQFGLLMLNVFHFKYYLIR